MDRPFPTSCGQACTNKQHRVKHKNQPQWMTPEILEAMKCRERHKSLNNIHEYRFWRNKVTKLISDAKKISISYSLKITKVIQVVFSKSFKE